MLALLLVLTLLVGIAPAAVFAADSTSDSQDDGFFRIVHLDCGRKYFSANWIKALIREMAAAGYNQLQLAFGNDGLRFLLDDMSFTANGTTYDHATVVSKVEAGNKAQNSSGDASWLTQSEMDDIIAEANKYGIEIVPLLNLPGHANAILDIVDDKYNASGSNNTLNVASSEEARNFGYAILQKYVDYFAGKIIHILLQNGIAKVARLLAGSNIEGIVGAGSIILVIHNVQNGIGVAGQVQQGHDLNAVLICLGNDVVHLRLSQPAGIAAAVLRLVTGFHLGNYGCMVISSAIGGERHIVQQETQAIVTEGQLQLVISGGCHFPDQCLDPVRGEVLPAAVQMDNPEETIIL